LTHLVIHRGGDPTPYTINHARDCLRLETLNPRRRGVVEGFAATVPQLAPLKKVAFHLTSSAQLGSFLDPLLQQGTLQRLRPSLLSQIETIEVISSAMNDDPHGHISQTLANIMQACHTLKALIIHAPVHFSFALEEALPWKCRDLVILSLDFLPLDNEEEEERL
ncbi:hypothetical protein BGX23_011816, partial [Mortierella sp. AD031]